MENSKINGDDLHFKGMKIYNNPQRIYKQIQQAGYDSGKLTVELLSKFDNYHYYGTQTVDKCIDKLQISKDFKVLDFGSGLGGPARYMANKTHCHVTAVEIQEELNEIALELTKRCELSDRVHHIRQNIRDFDIETNQFDCAIGWLVLNHIKDKAGVIKKLFNLLKKGGKIYLEDFYQKGHFTEEQRAVMCLDSLPVVEDYHQYLADAGFINAEFIDISISYKKCARERYEKFTEQLPKDIALMGEETAKTLLAFHTSIHHVYDGDTVGGIRIVAQRPED